MTVGRLFKRLVLVLAIVLLCVVGTVAWLVGTVSGSRFAVEQAAKRVAGLEVQGVSETLWSGVSLASLRYRDTAVDLDARALSARWRLTCLLEQVVCLDALHVEALQVNVLAPESPDTAPSSVQTPLPTVELPVDVTLAALRLGRVDITSGTSVMSLGDLLLSAQWSGVDLSVSALSFDWVVDQVSGALALNGDLSFNGDYPLGVQAHLAWDDGAFGTVDVPLDAVDIRLGNTIAHPEVWVTGKGDWTPSLHGRLATLTQPLGVSLTLDIPEAQWPLTGEPQVSVADSVLSLEGHLDRLDVGLDGYGLSGCWPPLLRCGLQRTWNRMRHVPQAASR